MEGNVFDQYVNLFGSINFTSIIIIILVFGAVMITVSVIKYNLNAYTIKRNVKAAIRELIAEEEISIKRKETNKEVEILDVNKDTTK
jgi:ArsR family metal-binding transcriptional regulator